MPYDLTFRVLIPLTLGLTSLAFIAIGLYALIRRRPFIIHSRWMLVLVLIVFSPQILMPLSMFFSEPRYRTGWLDAASLISVCAMVVAVAYIALQMRGYIVFGTTQESFREALLSALASLNLKVEETMSSVKLPSIPPELQTPVHGWLGTGQVRLRNGGRPRLLEDIGTGMTAYFDSGNAKTNMTTAIAYLILGVLMVGMVIAMSMGWPAHPNGVAALVRHMLDAA
jgi:hypothetical protein